jgi:hypothetical protein
MKGKPIVVAVRNKTRDGLIPFAGSRESAVEEFGGGAAGVDPIVHEQVVNSSGMITSSNATFWARSFSTRSVVCWDGTLRSSSQRAQAVDRNG